MGHDGTGRAAYIHGRALAGALRSQALKAVDLEMLPRRVIHDVSRLEPRPRIGRSIGQRAGFVAPPMERQARVAASVNERQRARGDQQRRRHERDDDE